MPIIKVSYQHPTWPMLRQTPGCLGVWGDYTFVYNRDVAECDGWVVLGNLLKHKEVTQCPPNRVLLINDEPPTMRGYPEKYLSQFANIATCGGCNFKHPGVIEVSPPLPWYVGVKQRDLHAPDKDETVRLTYDDLRAFKPPQKTKLLSIMYSKSKFTEGHTRRHEFVQVLKGHFGDRLDIFGRGFRFVTDKWDAIADYEYHIAIENSSFPHYWTEKLSDPFLGWSFPIYCGCPNVSDYFDPRSFETIDMESPEQAIMKIEQVLSRRPWESSLPYLAESRRRVLDEYNFFPMAIKLLNLPKQSEKKEKVELRSIAATLGLTRTMLRRVRAKLQFGLGITRLFPFLRRF